MSEEQQPKTGSRFLYEPFNATAAKVDTIEKVNEERWRGLERRLMVIETMLERLEKRLWLAVYGIAAFVLTQAVYQLIQLNPN